MASKEKGQIPISFFLGLPFNSISSKQAYDECISALSSRRMDYYSFAGLEETIESYRRLELRKILFNADRLFCSSRFIWQLAQYTGVPMPGVVKPRQLLSNLMEHCARCEFPVYFFGEQEYTIDETIRKIRRRYPKLKIAGHLPRPSGGIFHWNNTNIMEVIQAKKPRLLLTALGANYNDLWFFTHRSMLQVPLSIGAGNDFSVLLGTCGNLKFGLEKGLWERAEDIYFLIQEAYRQRASMKRRKKGAVTQAAASSPPSHQYHKLQWDGAVDQTTIGKLDRPINYSRNIVCDCSRVSFVDSSGLGHIAQLAKNALREGRFFCLMTPSDVLARAIEATHMGKLIQIMWSDEELMDRLKSHEEALVLVKPADNGMDYIIKPLVDLGQNTISRIEKEAAYLLPRIRLGGKVLLNLEHIHFIDSIAVGGMLGLRKQLDKKGVPMKVTGLNPATMKTLKLLRLNNFLADAIEAVELEVIEDEGTDVKALTVSASVDRLPRRPES